MTTEEIIRREIEGIANIPSENDFERAIETIYNAVQNQKGKLLTSGIGKSGDLAKLTANMFSSTGTPSLFLHPSSANHGDCGIVRKEDIFLFFSNSGETKETVLLCNLVKGWGLPIIVIVGNPKSQLAQMADVVISTGRPKEIDPLGLVPIVSITAMKIISDILVVMMMKKIKLTFENYVKLHPGGEIGQRLRKGSS